MLQPPRLRTGSVLVALILVALVVAGATAWSVDERPTTIRSVSTRDVRIDVLDGPRKKQRVQIDLRLYVPAETPAPAVMLAHGFGGDKSSLATPARRLAARGFTVLTYSSRGFGNSTGKIALNSPAYEVTDAKQILDWLARQPEVVSDGAGDPLVGVAGVSYGGALSLLLAGSDERVDAIAPMMTYNDLTQALLPNAAARSPIPPSTAARGSFASEGVFKQAWASLLFTTGTRASDRQEAPRGRRDDLPPGQRGTGPPAPPDSEPATCGNLTARICAAYTELAQTGHASKRTLELLTAASPKSVTANIDIPTLLVQGLQDPLFGLAQADANARQIAAAGGRVKMIWYAGGHDPADLGPKLWNRVGDWFAYHLDEPGGPPVPRPGTAFEYQVADDPEPNVPDQGGTRDRGTDTVRTVVAPSYPGVHSERVRRVVLPLRGKPVQVVNPPGGGTAPPRGTSEVAASPEPPVNTSSALEPGSSGTGGSTSSRVAVFRTDPVEDPVLITGIGQTRLSVSSVPGQPSSGQAVLFARLYDVGPDGQRTPLGNGVAPLRVTGLPADGSPVEIDVALPGMVHRLEAGHRLELSVSTTNPAYSTPEEPAVHIVGLAGDQALSLPSVRGTVVTEGTVPVVALTGTGVLVGLVLLGWAVAAVIRRHGGRAPDPRLGDTPLVTSELGKSYSGGPTAVHDLSIRVERGQIVGLLGPNGAGKTTTLRMILGLQRPDSGGVEVFGHPVSSGSPVLSRVGSFVESPGLLPHLSGLDNLRSYWEATGRSASRAHFDEVLEVAGLGEAADRRISTYGQGMRQRLAIAQAMLGMPDLLVLDEPTVGLDPSQSQLILDVLRRYAATGRAVLLSSHLLNEVEQICTHVIVMRRGECIASGSVAEVVSGQETTTFEVDQPARAAEALRALEGIGRVEAGDAAVHAELATHSPATAVNTLVAAEISVNRVAPRRKLEEAFLALVEEEHR